MMVRSRVILCLLFSAGQANLADRLSPSQTTAPDNFQPTAFQGGSQAIEDGAAAAVCLAMAGGRPEDVPLALKVFEAMRRPRVCVAQALGQAVSERAMSMGSLLTPYPSTHQQQDIWHEYFDDPSQRDDGARSGTAASLHPISFDLYGYDIEDDVLRHFSEVATAIDVNVHLNKQRTAEAAQKANIAVGVQRLSLADCMDCDVLWEESGAVSEAQAQPPRV